MKVLLLLILSALTLSAQSYSTITPGYGGSYFIWNSDGSYSTVTHNNYGGSYFQWNSDGSYSTYTPQYGGGYRVWNSDSTYQGSNGGYNPYGR